MDSADLQALDAALDWLGLGHGVALATVTRTWGSSPRPPGSWLALRDDGRIAGSVSGGCVEDDLSERIRSGSLHGPRPFPLTYGVSAAEAARFGLPCGGRLELLIEPAPETATLRALRRELRDGRAVQRTVEVASGAVILEPAPPRASVAFDGARLVTVHGPRRRLLLIGAGQIARFLAEIAQGMDYEVSLCDPREDYLEGWAVPGVRLLPGMPDDAVTAWKPDTHSAVVALSHDPKLDDLALLDALATPAFYVAAIGSLANQAKRRERLRGFDLSEDQVARLRGPAGLPIGSHTPPEIAVAIAAEMTAVKNGVTCSDWPVAGSRT